MKQDPITESRERARQEELAAQIEKQKELDAAAESYRRFDRAMNRAFKGIFPRDARRRNMRERIKRAERRGEIPADGD